MMEVFTIPAKTVTTTMGFYNYCYLQWSSSFKSMCIFAQKKKKSPNQNQSFLKFSFSQNKLFTFSVSFCIEALFWKKGLYLYRRQWWPQTSSWSHLSSSHYTVLHTRIPLSIIDACSFICYMNFSPYTQESQTSVESFT